MVKYMNLDLPTQIEPMQYLSARRKIAPCCYRVCGQSHRFSQINIKQMPIIMEYLGIL